MRDHTAGQPHGTRGAGDFGPSPDQRPAGGIDSSSLESQRNGLAYAAMVFGIGAVFLAPIILGPLAIILGVMSRNRGQSLANVALTIAVLGTVVGLVLGYIAATIVVENGIPQNGGAP